MRAMPLVIHDGSFVVECCEASLARGIKPGLSIKESKALLREDGHHEKPPKVASRAWLDIAAECSNAVEPVSAWEAYIDLSSHPEPLLVASELLSRIHSAEQVVLLGGISPLKWLARKTTQVCPPGALQMGILPLEPALDAPSLIASMPLAEVSLLSPAVQERFEFLGCRFVHEALLLSPQTLKKQFGKEASDILRVLSGRGADRVRPLYPPASLSASLVLGGPVEDGHMIDKSLADLANRLAIALNQTDKRAEALRLTAYNEDGAWFSSFRRLSRPLMAAFQLLVALRRMVEDHPLPWPVVRFVVRAENLASREAWQQTLLGQTPEAQRLRAIESAAKEVAAMFGDGRVLPAAQLSVPRRQKVLNAWKHAIGWRQS
jgi:hypothetical protein